MHFNKIVLSLVLLCVVCSRADAQQKVPSIRFEHPGHNFGMVMEADGILQHDFVFTNKGEAPLIITNVTATGGVSVSGWTRNPVMPGNEGNISLVYDPANKPGKFNRSITVYSTGNPSSSVLRLLGEVVPRQKTTAELYPAEIGSLRLKSNHLSFGRIPPDSVKRDSLEIINLSEKPLDIAFSHVPAHISIGAVPGRLNPGEKGWIFAIYDAGQPDEWGVITHYSRLSLNGASPPGNMIYLSANIQEDFSALSPEERAEAPSIEFENRIFDFGRLRHGENLEHNFMFRNSGRSELIIRAVRAGCGCTAIEPQKSLLSPGETSSIKAIFDSRGFRGRQNKSIMVITNDPANPNIVLRLTGEVIAD
jgi:hypothetical protein